MVDLLILIFLISALYRGREIGFVQQLCSTIGFFAGLFLGTSLAPHTIQLTHSALSRSLITLITTLGSAFILLTAGEYIGIALKQRLQSSHLHSADNFLGAFLSAGSLLVAVWLGAAILMNLPYPGLQSSLRSSRIVSQLNHSLPSAPTVIASLGHIIDPNGFPNVFIGGEPTPPSSINLPSSSALLAAVNKDKSSVVKIEGEGCGGIVEGSGFVVGSDLVATNAHVVAGIAHPYVDDANGTHSAVPIWFDPNLDFAVLRVPNLAGSPLLINTATEGSGTAAAVLGYPGGGGFTADPASVLDEFNATGRDIYNQGVTQRDIYEVAAHIIPGNSGGPLITPDGQVVGIVFAQSTTYNNVGYALTTAQAVQEINQATARDQVVSTGSCAE
ncbi:MAG TPA: MarP family serine protease [Candidatus Saccharimonadales bacterium]|nr:MarP family serine protease [Candidatus Saccharimonadales bacterium]